MKFTGKLVLPLLVVFALLPASCRMSYSFSGADVPAAANTFSVENFTVTAPLANPLYSQRLSERLKDLLLSQTRLDFVKSNGDLQFGGTVVLYEVVPAGIQGNETAAANRLRIRVRVNYINSFDQSKNFEREFERFADFDAGQILSNVEAGLISQINDQLVQDIFNASLGNW